MGEICTALRCTPGGILKFGPDSEQEDESMDGILKKIRLSDAFNKENRVPFVKAIVLMSLFTFTFLGAEFLFVNMVSRTVSGNQSVASQNYALGVSAVGFVLYPLFCRVCRGRVQSAVSLGAAMVSVGCLFLICRHSTYALTLGMGLVLFLLLGAFGSAVFYKALCLLEDNTYTARLVGISYMLGVLLQIANNNLIHTDILEAVILSAFILLLTVMLIRAEKSSIVPAFSKDAPQEETEIIGKSSMKIGIILALFVAMMTCIFSTLDNAVTLYHARGEVNIGQWARVLLALSGLLAGFLFDTAGRKYMSMIMYCIMILSTTCLVVLQFAGPFTVGLLIFYLSAGFFAVFFTASFMEIARYTRTPQLWAGLGRAVNNLVAVAITGGSLMLLDSGNMIAITVIELLLFVLTSVAAFVYTNQREAFFKKLNAKSDAKLRDGERLQKMAEQFSLTPREAEVIGLLVHTDDGLQAIADRLYVSRRTLERYVSAIYEKTGTKSRIGLVSLYNSL